MLHIQISQVLRKQCILILIIVFLINVAQVPLSLLIVVFLDLSLGFRNVFGELQGPFSGSLLPHLLKWLLPYLWGLLHPNIL